MTVAAGSAGEPIAVVGIGCRMPGGVADGEAFWSFLAGGGDAVREVPPDRFRLEEWFDPLAGTPGRLYCRHLGALEGIRRFDHALFGIAPREAATMDPQHRLLLEVAWSACEDAGENPRALAGTRTGVFIGAFSDDYTQRLMLRREAEAIDGHAALGVLRGLAAGRLSYHLDLHGPALTVDTACSSSLVAAHLAVQSLRAGECDLALAGGVNLVLSPEITVALCQLRALSPSGRCRPFAAGADGYVRGEGCGIVVLKRLGDALAEGARIVAVIRGSAVNHDGRSNGIAAPHPAAQEAVIRAALADAGAEADEIGYVEAHGTGTVLGDPIELRALSAALGTGTGRGLVVGSAKSNFGHLEAAAGVAGLIKLALSLQHGEIPPSLHRDAPNPHVEWARIGITVAEGLRSWPAAPLGGVSAFGMSGTNAHLVLAPPPARSAPGCVAERQVLALSAPSPEALQAMAATLQARLAGPRAPALADVCHTLNAGRAVFPVRAAFVAADAAGLAAALRDCRPVRVAAQAAPRLAVVFGATMDDASLAGEPAFRRALAALAPAVEGMGPEAAALAAQLAAAAVLREWGVRPAILLGFGVGEIAAACAAGVMTPPTALALAAARGAAALAAARDPAGPGADPLALRPSFAALLAGRLHAPGVELISGLLARPVRDEMRSPAFWADQACRPAGPAAAAALGAARPDHVVALGAGLHAGAADLLETGFAAVLGGLHEAGFVPDWRAVGRARGGRRIALPGHVFAGPELDLVGPVAGPRRGQQQQEGLLAGAPLVLAASAELRRELNLDAPGLGFLRQHRLDGRPVLAGAAIAEILAQAARAAGAEGMLDGIRFEAPIWLDQPGGTVLQTVLQPDGGLVLHGRAGSGAAWTRHASARLGETGPARPEPAGAPWEMPEVLGLDAVLRQPGLEHGPPFRGLRRLWAGDGAAMGEIVLPEGEAAGGFRLDPRLLDACLRVASPLLGAGPAGAHWLPAGIGRLSAWHRLPDRLRCHARLIAATDRAATLDYELFDADDTPLARLGGVEMRLVAPAATPGARFARVAWEALDAGPTPAGAPRRWLVHGLQEADALVAALRALGQDAAAIPSGGEVAALLGAGATACLVHIASAEEPLAACLAVLPVARALAGTGGELVLVTRNGQQARRDDPPVRPAQAALWGFGRALARERVRVRLVDREAGTDAAALAHHLAHHLAGHPAGTAPEASALRDGAVLVPGLLDAAAAAPPPLVLPAAAPRAPGPGEVAIDVVASGLNFRDVLHARGMLPATAGAMPFGLECSGVVRAVGAGVAGLAAGDAVMAGLALGSLSGAVTLPACCVVPLPAGLGWREAAALPLAYLTASYGLEHVAGLRAGQRVLIHAAAGGVGQLAVGLARALGAEVFATASPRKWAALRRQGVRHVFSSRDTGFVAGIREATAGAGVDVVLHGLGGAFVAAGLDCLAPGGCFVEIGKLGAWTAEQARAHRPDIRFARFDLMDIRRDEALVAAMMRALVDRLAAGAIRPPPVESFPLAEAAAAFEHMAHAGHFGKIVLWHGGAGRSAIMPDASYLITGGLGALGLATARWLVGRGARSVVLVGRRAPDAAGRAAVAALGRQGARITCLAADLADRDALAGVLGAIDAELPPLRGVVHAAGVLEDGVAANQDAGRFARVFAGKVEGARNLDALTRERRLDFFWLYASLAGVLGQAGQTNYAAANATLDAIALCRAALGLPALSIDWGPWSAGMAMRSGADAGALVPIDPAEAEAVLDRLLLARGGQIVVTGGPLPGVAGSADRLPAPAPVPAPPGSLERRIRAAPAADRRSLLTREVRAIAAAALGIGPERLDVEQELAAAGFDSLVNIEMRAELEEGLAIALEPSFGFDHPSIAAMVEHLLGLLRLPAPAASPGAFAAGESDAAAALISELDRLRI